MTSRLAVAVVLAFSLAACGSDSASDEAPDDAATSAAPAAMASEAPAAAASEVPAPEATESASPAPTPSASAAPTPAPSPTTVAAAGPPEAFKQCSVCHKTTPGDNLIGPTLAGVVGRKAGAVAGFKYSPAMADSGITWTAAELDTYLADPKKEVPGTTMAFAGVKDAAKRADIIAYLKTL